jgi:hypothetical protein
MEGVPRSNRGASTSASAVNCGAIYCDARVSSTAPPAGRATRTEREPEASEGWDGGFFLKFFIRFFAALACLNASLTFGTEPDKNPDCPAELIEILSSPPELLGLSLLDKLHFSPKGTDFFAPIGLNKKDAKIAQTLKAQFLYLAEQFDDSASADGTVPDSLLEATKVLF